MLTRKGRATVATTIAMLAAAGCAATAFADGSTGTGPAGIASFQSIAAAGGVATVDPATSSVTITPVGNSSAPVTEPLSTLQAEGSFGECATGYLCGWENSGYNNPFWSWQATGGNSYQWHEVQAAANNQISAIYNDRANDTLVTRFYPPEDRTTIVCLTAQTAIQNLNSGHFWPDGYTANDSISGYDFLGSGSGCEGYEQNF